MGNIQKYEYATAEKAFEELSRGIPLAQVAARMDLSPSAVLDCIKQHRSSFVMAGKDVDLEMMKQFEYGRLEHAQGVLANLLEEIGSVAGHDIESKAKMLSAASQVATAFTRISERKSKLAGFDEPVETRHVTASVTPESLLKAARTIEANVVEH